VPRYKQGLSDKQRRFVDVYLECGNASEAARQAGYKTRPDSIGEENLRKPEIQEAIKAAREKIKVDAPVNHAWVVAGLRAIAEKTAAKDNDRIRAFELIGKHLGMFD